MTDQPETYKTLEDIEQVVRKFESCAYDPSEFHHPEHLIVAFWYLTEECTEQAALARMRASLFRFVNHHKLERVYHETITLFWLKRVRLFLNQTDGERTLVRLVNELIQTCGDPQLIYSHFTKERLESEEARERWLEPDTPLKGI